MNDSVASNFTAYRNTQVEALICLLANVLLAEDGLSPIKQVNIATNLLNTVFDGKKIACIKFIREQTGMGLKDSKEFCEDYVWEHRRRDYSPSVIHRMQDRRGIRY